MDTNTQNNTTKKLSSKPKKFSWNKLTFNFIFSVFYILTINVKQYVLFKILTRKNMVQFIKKLRIGIFFHVYSFLNKNIYIYIFLRITKHSWPDSNLSCGLVWWYGSWCTDERYLPLWPYATGKLFF